jgi:O-succinylbenzoic acid--CoA ligase
LPADEIGHVKVTAPFASSGYWNDAKATAEVWTDGWYSTGDMGTLDGDGRLTLLGRRKEVVNRSGHKILPIEVEREIAKHPTVFQCAVVAAPDAEYGQVPWAFVQVRDGMSMDADGLAAALREGGLATYKIPARFIELEELPQVSGNKIDKKRLLDMVPAE